MFFRKKPADSESGSGPEKPSATSPATASLLSATPPADQVPAERVGAASGGQGARRAAARSAAAAFGEIVALLMRAPAEGRHAIADLEWMVVPAILNGHYIVAEAHAQDTGVTAPVGAVLWALVSPEIDRRLSDTQNPPKLAPGEWRSGNLPWVMLAAGEKRVVSGLLQQLVTGQLKGAPVKMRVRGPDGKVSVGTITVRAKQPGTA